MLNRSETAPEWKRGVGLSALFVALMAGATTAEAQTSTGQAVAAEPAAGAVQAAGQSASAEPVAADSGKGDEIVVTAQFREQNLQDTPIAITAVTGAMMEARSQTSLLDVAQTAPNVQIRQAGAGFGNAAAVSIRGIGQYDVNFALEPGVGIYIDDVYHPTIFGSIFDLLDLDRVEILRGPQGILAGKNSIGGAVRLYSRKPNGDNDGFVEATVGTMGRRDFRGAAGFTLIDDKLFMRVSGVSKQEDGYVRRLDYGCLFPASGVVPVATSPDCKLGTLGGTNFQAVRGSLRWTPTQRLDVTLIGDVMDDHSEPSAQRLIYGSIPARAQFVPDDRFVSYQTFRDLNRRFTPPIENKMRAWGFSGTVSYDVADALKLKSITAYRRYDGAFTVDSDGGPGGPGLSYNTVSFKSFSQELRLNGAALDDALNYTLGVYYFKGDALQGGRTSLSSIDFLTNDPVKSESKSAFANIEFVPVTNLSLSAGVRYTDESKSYTFLRKDPFGNNPVPLVGALDGYTSRYKGDHWDYRLNASYSFNRDLMVYATVSTGFRGGGVNPRPFTPAQAIDFGPETLTAYEVGFKSDWFDRRLRLNGAAFYNKYHDILLTILNGYGGFPISAIPLNAGQADVKGVEAEATLRPVDGLLIDGSVGYIDFKYTSLTAAAIASHIGLDGVAPFTPTWKASGGIQYEIPLHGESTLTPRLDVIYQTSFYTNASNGPLNRNAGYTVLNGRLTFRPDDHHWEIAMSVTNLTNKYYYTNTYDNSASSQAVIANVARPREWALSVKRNF